jgi:hypothetical protein
MSAVHIHYYVDARGLAWFSKKICREVLGIRHRKTFNDFCKLLFKPPNSPVDGYIPPDYYTAAQVFEVLMMQEYLRVGYGQHSKQDYLKRKRTHTLEREFFRLGISVSLKHDWLMQQLNKIQENYGIETGIEICSSIHSSQKDLRRAS